MVAKEPWINNNAHNTHNGKFNKIISIRIDHDTYWRSGWFSIASHNDIDYEFGPEHCFIDARESCKLFLYTGTCRSGLAGRDGRL